MARIKRLLPVAIATVLLFSLFFVNGSIAQPLGAGLLDYVGVGSGGSSGGGSTQDAAFRFGLPVTVMNDDSSPVPVTMQGTSSEPLTATIDGTVDTNATVQGTVSTNQENIPGTQPFQTRLDFDFGGTGQIAGMPFDVPNDKILVIRYISGYQDVPTGDGVDTMSVLTTSDGHSGEHFLFPVQVESRAVETRYDYASEVWIEADAGTQVTVDVQRFGTGNWTGSTGILIISGYLLDPPATP